MSTATEDDYFADDTEMHSAATRLRWATTSTERSSLLFTLGDGDMRRAKLHTAVFGLDLDEDGVPQREWMADSARLLWIVAEAEFARSQRTTVPLQSVAYLDRVDCRTVELQHAADHILDAWVRRGNRRRLVRQLAAVWSGCTRGQAVESVYCVGARMPWWVRLTSAATCTPGRTTST